MSWWVTITGGLTWRAIVNLAIAARWNICGVWGPWQKAQPGMAVQPSCSPYILELFGDMCFFSTHLKTGWVHILENVYQGAVCPNCGCVLSGWQATPQINFVATHLEMHFFALHACLKCLQCSGAHTSSVPDHWNMALACNCSTSLCRCPRAGQRKISLIGKKRSPNKGTAACGPCIS